MDISKYENKIVYPDRPIKPRLKKGASPDEIRLHADDVECWEKQKVRYKEAIDKYHDENTRLQTKFKEDALKEHGIEHNLKADDAYRLAWSYGHSSGLNEVYNYLGDLAELIRE